MGKLQSGSDAPTRARHEFTEEESERGRRSGAERARRRRVVQARRDAQLWNAYQQAQYGRDGREIARTRTAWSEHQALLPVRGRRG